MPRFTNALSGVTVSVDDERAKSMDAEWEPVKDSASKSTAKKTAAKKSDSNN